MDLSLALLLQIFNVFLIPYLIADTWGVTTCHQKNDVYSTEPLKALA